MNAPPEVFELKRIMLRQARDCIGRSTYDYDAMHGEAPGVVNCYELVRWLFESTIGRLLAVQLLIDGDLVAIDLEEVGLADLIFVEREGHPDDDFGHVGFVTGEGTVINAAWRPKKGVFEEPLEVFLARGKYIGARHLPEYLYCRSV